MEPTVPRSLGKYTLIAEIAKSSMATIYLATVTPDHAPKGAKEIGGKRVVVIKQLHADHADEPKLRNMFLDEGRISARFNHRNIVTTYEVGQEDDRLFYAMEYLEGRTLDAVLTETKGKLTPPAILRVACQVLAGLHYAHELTDQEGAPLAIIHRDVSPQNVFITYDGQIKLLDFGVAKSFGRSQVSEEGVLKGRVHSMSPEYIADDAIDRRADVYAVGVLLREALTNKSVWDGVGEMDVLKALMAKRIPPFADPNVPEELRKIVEKAMSPSRDDRYRTAHAMRATIEQYVARVDPKGSITQVTDVMTRELAPQRTKMRLAVEKNLLSASTAGPIPRLTGSVANMPAVKPPVPTPTKQIPAVPAPLVPRAAPSAPSAPGSKPKVATGSHPKLATGSNPKANISSNPPRKISAASAPMTPPRIAKKDRPSGPGPTPPPPPSSSNPLEIPTPLGEAWPTDSLLDDEPAPTVKPDDLNLQIPTTPPASASAGDRKTAEYTPFDALMSGTSESAPESKRALDELLGEVVAKSESSDALAAAVPLPVPVPSPFEERASDLPVTKEEPPIVAPPLSEDPPERRSGKTSIARAEVAAAVMQDKASANTKKGAPVLLLLVGALAIAAGAGALYMRFGRKPATVTVADSRPTPPPPVVMSGAPTPTPTPSTSIAAAPHVMPPTTPVAVSVKASPFHAVITVDDAPGKNPWTGKLPRGPHVVKVTAPGFSDHIETVDVDEATALEVRLIGAGLKPAPAAFRAGAAKPGPAPPTTAATPPEAPAPPPAPVATPSPALSASGTVPKREIDNASPYQ